MIKHILIFYLLLTNNSFAHDYNFYFSSPPIFTPNYGPPIIYNPVNPYYDRNRLPSPLIIPFNPYFGYLRPYYNYYNSYQNFGYYRHHH